MTLKFRRKNYWCMFRIVDNVDKLSTVVVDNFAKSYCGILKLMTVN